MRIVGLFALLFLFLSPGLGEDTVAEDLGVHQLGRLVELLTHRECENLLAALSHPEDSVFHQLERLSPESNDLGLPPRVRRDTDRETQCRTALTGWLVNHGQQMYYDRLSRALQRIGRTDIAIEVGKNINQDKALSLQKYVEDYHRRVEAVGSSLVEPDMEPLQLASRQSTRQVRDLTWKDLELVVEREQRPPYSRRLADGVLPLVYGLVLGFTGALLVGALVLFCALHISQAHGSRLFRLCRKNRAKRRPSPAHFSCDLTSSESDSGMPLRPDGLPETPADSSGAFSSASGGWGDKSQAYRSVRSVGQYRICTVQPFCQGM